MGFGVAAGAVAHSRLHVLVLSIRSRSRVVMKVLSPSFAHVYIGRPERQIMFLILVEVSMACGDR